MDKLKNIIIHYKDKKEANNIYLNTFNTLINWENNKVKLWIDCNETVVVEQITKNKNKESVVKKHTLKEGLHFLDITPDFSEEKIINVESSYEKEENIIINECFGFNRWLVNFENNIIVPPAVNWQYTSVSGIWNERATWKNLNENELIKNCHEIEWLVSNSRKADINELISWCDYHNISSKISYI